MRIIDLIKITGADVAFRNGILKNNNYEEIPKADKLVKDFIDKIMINLNEFNIKEHFDYCKFNLLEYAFIYTFGKGAEHAFFTSLGNEIKNIDYNFDNLMEEKYGEMLPDHLNKKLNEKYDAMVDIYSQMFELTCISHEKMAEENTSFEYCISEMLNFAFVCGKEICLSDKITEDDKAIKYNEWPDSPYIADKYNHKYKLEGEV